MPRQCPRAGKSRRTLDLRHSWNCCDQPRPPAPNPAELLDWKSLKGTRSESMKILWVGNLGLGVVRCPLCPQGFVLCAAEGRALQVWPRPELGFCPGGAQICRTPRCPLQEKGWKMCSGKQGWRGGIPSSPREDVEAGNEGFLVSLSAI